MYTNKYAFIHTHAYIFVCMQICNCYKERSLINSLVVFANLENTLKCFPKISFNNVMREYINYFAL